MDISSFMWLPVFGIFALCFNHVVALGGRIERLERDIKRLESLRPEGAL